MVKKPSPLFVALLLAAAASQLLGGSSASAQAATNSKTLPNEAMINHIFDCGWMLTPQDEQSAKQRSIAKAFELLPFKQNTQSNIPEYKGKVRALGTEFDLLRGGGVMGGVYIELQGTNSSLDIVLRHFAAQNRPMVRSANPFSRTAATRDEIKNAPPGRRSWLREDIDTDMTVSTVVLDRAGGLDDTNTAPGVSVICFAGPTSAENVKKLGLVPISDIQAVLNTGEVKPAAWADGLIASKSIERMRMLAGYAHLTAPQISALLATGNYAVAEKLIFNKGALFTSTQLDALISNPEHVDSLALNRFAQLDASQTVKVMARASAQTKDALVLRKRDSQADSRLMQIINSGDQQTIMASIYQYGVPNSQHIDRLLQSRDVELRRAITMNIKFTPMPAQLEQILNDPDATVRIGMLRRDDVAIPAALVSLGINHPDKRLQFWYAMRKDYVPSAAEVEMGLTSTDTPERRGWLMNKNTTLTKAQIDRAFNDPGTRSFVAARPDVKLSPEQIERCITDDDYFMRDTCVRRADFEINPARFATLMRDKNPNIPETLVRESKKRNIDLASFLDGALAAGDVELLIAISKTRALDITDAQFKAAIALNVPAVRTAFCQREQAKCGS